MRPIIFPLIFGLAGIIALVSLGIWQVQRLAWKEGVLAQIDSRIAAAPVAIPTNPDPERDKYLPVEVRGDFLDRHLRVLVSRKGTGAGYRIISTMETGAGLIMVDRGYVRASVEGPVPAGASVEVTGNLHWPDEVDGYTPEPDLEAGIWFARDVARMAEHLGTRPILVVAAETSETDPFASPLRLDSQGIPNDHLSYAITWFSLAAIWVIMTATFLWRQRRPAKGN